jgi:Zn-finger nucleic acid-binding protein
VPWGDAGLPRPGRELRPRMAAFRHDRSVPRGALPQDGRASTSTGASYHGRMDASPESYQCPRCHTHLQAAATSDVVVSACWHCGGTWLDNPASVRVFELLDPTTIDLARSGGSSGPGSDMPDLALRIDCPVCQKPMDRRQSTAGEVSIDLCPAHGTWLDRDELLTIVGAVAAQRGVAAPLPPVTAGTGTQGGSGLGKDLANSAVGDVAGAVGGELAGGVLDAAFSLVAALFG